MTHRENEILRLIKENPFISQNELAQRLGITRSAVSVHIMHLTQKQLIRGRGYYVRQRAYMAVIGTSNIDIRAVSLRNQIGREAGPAKIDFTLGGVGRNFAETMARLSVDVEFMSIFADDFYGKAIKEKCMEQNIGIAHALTVPGIKTSVYISMHTRDKRQGYSLSDLEIYKNITPAFIADRKDIINNASACYLDPGIPAETLAYAFACIKVPIICQPVTLSRALKLKAHMGKIYALLIGAKAVPALLPEIAQGVPLCNICDRLMETGVRLAVCLGENGKLYIKKDSGVDLSLSTPLRFDFDFVSGHEIIAAAAMVYQYLLQPSPLAYPQVIFGRSPSMTEIFALSLKPEAGVDVSAAIVGVSPPVV